MTATSPAAVARIPTSYLIAIFGTLFALAVNSVMFGYQHGRLEQKVIDNTVILERVRDQQERDMTIITQLAQQMSDIDKKCIIKETK
jgi:hypothetical protein